MSMSFDRFAYEPARHEAEVMAWRRARLARLTAKDSWLSLVGRFPLADGDHAAGAADGCDVRLPDGRAPAWVGTFTVRGRDVSFTSAPGVTPMLCRGADQRPLSSSTSVQLVSDRLGAPDRLTLGTLSMEVMERDSGVFIRVRDPDNPARTQFPGLDYYPIEPSLRVIAKLEPYAPMKELHFAYDSGSTEPYLSPGAAVFEVGGVQCRLDPVLDGDRKRLFLIFRDETSRNETYGAGRFMYPPLPEDGRVLLDFNQAFNPPCAFTPFALCPLPPPQNHLPLRIEAGEKRPLDP